MYRGSLSMKNDQINQNDKSFSVKEFVLRYNAVIMLIALIIVSSLLSNVFFTTISIFNLLRQNTPLLMVSLGMLMVILTGGIDLSVGSIAGVSAMKALSVAIESWKWSSAVG